MDSKDQEQVRVAAWLRPLAISELEEERMLGLPAALEAKDILAFAGGGGKPMSQEEVIRRYKEISTDDLDLIAVPADGKILEKIVWPLKGAKVCYCLGQHLACVAMAALVGEMAAMLVHEVRIARPNKPNQNQSDEFEKKGQLARIGVLSRLGLIDKEIEKLLRDLQGTRRGYMHFLSFNHTQLHADAKKSYVAAFRVVHRLVGMKLVPGSYAFHVDPDILRYAKDREAGVQEGSG